MQTTKRFLLVLVVAIFCGAYSTFAQELEVKVRPERPHYERVVAPSPRHVWIDEDWEPRGGTYVFVGGRWAEPPHPGWIWMPGHWKETPRGHMWIRGHWRHR